MMSTSRFPNGITNRPKNDSVGEMGQLDATKLHTFFTDFDTYNAGDWVVSEVGVGTQALADADGGVLDVTTNTATFDQGALQTVGESFAIEAGKKTWFKSRLKLNDATQSDMVVGLQIRDTAPTVVSDGIYFSKADGNPDVSMLTRQGNSSVAVIVGSMPDDTYTELDWYYDGDTRVEGFFNGELVGALTSRIPYGVELTVSFAIRAGTTAAKVLSVDYLLVAKER